MNKYVYVYMYKYISIKIHICIYIQTYIYIYTLNNCSCIIDIQWDILEFIPDDTVFGMLRVTLIF